MTINVIVGWLCLDVLERNGAIIACRIGGLGNNYFPSSKILI